MKQPLSNLKAKKYLLMFSLLFIFLGVSKSPSFALKLMPPEFKEISPIQKQAVEYLKNNEFDKVILLGTKMVKDKPEDFGGYLLLSLAYIGKGDVKNALAEAERAKRIRPEYGFNIYLYIGKAFATEKRYFKALIYLKKASKIKQAPEVMKQIASIYLARGQVIKARQYYEQVLDSLPDYLNLSRIYLLEKHYQQAVMFAKKAIKENQKALGGYVILGNSYLMMNEFDHAKQSYLRILNLHPKFFMVIYYLGLIDIIQHKYDQAIDNFSKVISISPRIKEAHLGKAVAWHLRGDLDKAQDTALKAIDAAPHDFLAYLALGNICISLNEHRKANAAFEKAAKLFHDFALPGFKASDYFKGGDLLGPANFTLSNIYLREGLFRQAIGAVDAGLGASSNENPYLLLTKALAESKLGNLKKAEKTYARVMKKHPLIVSACIGMGDLLAHRGDINKAIVQYIKASRIAPKWFKPHLVLGYFYIKNGKTEKAIREFKKVISLFPESVIGYNQLAWVLTEKTKKYNLALTYALKGYKLDNENIDMQDTLGWIYYKLQEYKKAEKVYARITSAKIKNPVVFYHSGQVYTKLNKKEKAAVAFENALNISEEFDGASNAKRMLKRMYNF